MQYNTKIMVIEGDDGVGKTTLALNTVKFLDEIGISALFVDKQSAPIFAQRIRQIVSSPDFKDTSSNVRALMFSSYLLNIYEECIFPLIGKYEYIIIDRSYLATLAYQFDATVIPSIQDFLVTHMPIDIVVLLTVDRDTGIERIQRTRNTPLDVIEASSTPEVIEARSVQYNKNIRLSNPEAIFVIDANGSEYEVADMLKFKLQSYRISSKENL